MGGYRLNQERQNRLEPKRIESCKQKLESLGVRITSVTKREIQFLHKGRIVKFWPYSGWHSGPTIKDGRGFQNLLKQIQQ